uniref:Surface protein D n=2 Tax=Theileria TaxID=5873 RepID=Q8I746_THEAN|nr:surface protein [Theileria sp. China]CAD55729.2 surface protein D precursor [Theileria annulata]CAH04884.1 putative surface protein D [Theileria annulata]CAH04886.1 putative surface protein D [Theileria annulata]
MKLTAGLVRLYFLIFIINSSVLGNNNCTDDELNAMGMLDNVNVNKDLLFKTSHMMGKVGKKHGIKPGTRTEKFLSELMKMFSQHGVEGVSEKCLNCFAASIQCVATKCKGPCLKGPCSDDCQNCIKANCMKALLECIGKDEIPNPCTWKEEYLKYKLPKTEEKEDDESKKKGEASGGS